MLVALACVAMLAVRHVVLPQIASHRAEIAAYLSKQLGQPVEIEAIATGWDGWNPEVSVRGLTVRDRAGASTTPLLELPDVTAVVSWTSLPLMRLQLKELAIDRPRLAVRRDTSGRLHVAGLEIDPDAASDDSPFADWLLRQRRIVVRDALITWNDDRRNAPQLVLDRVRFRMENLFGRHRLGLTGVPPPEIAAPIDVRAELAGGSLRDWQRAKGELYVRLDYADLAAWSEWLPLPVPVESGRGALRTWFGIDEGVVGSMVADLELEDVRTRLRSDLPALELDHVAGRVRWEQQGDRRGIEARALAAQLRAGLTLQPLDLSIAWRVDAKGDTVSGDARAERLELEPLAALAVHVPLPDALRLQLARQSPKGVLDDASFAWSGSIEAPATFRARARLRDVGLRPEGERPGVAGLSGAIEATEHAGTVKLESRGTIVALPAVFAQPLALDVLNGEGSWERRADGWAVRGALADASNADVSASGTFAWQSRAKGPGAIDLDAKVARVDARRLDRYLPLQLAPDVRAWLARAIPQGTAGEGRVVLKGDLGDFPFAGGRGGQFLATAKVRGASLDYAPGWPALSDVDADLRFEGARMLIQASRARVLGASIARAAAEIPDLRSPRLRIDGEAGGPTASFLAFVARSPVAGWIGHATDGWAASGNGRLGLRFELPLSGTAAASVAGDYQFAGNHLRIPGLPELEQLNGTIHFTDREMRGSDLAFEAAGGPVRANVVATGADVSVSASGTARIAQVRADFPSRWLEHASGSADWKLAFEQRGGTAAWTLESPLRGTVVDLPPPFGKAADAVVPLRVERRALPSSPGRDQLRVDYGSQARVVADRRLHGDEHVADRVLVLVGRAVSRGGEPDQPGIAIRASVDAINVDDWIALAATFDAPVGSAPALPPLDVASVDVAARALDVAGRAFHDASVVGRRSGGDWRLTLAAKEVEGTATWESKSSRLANGKLVARLSRLAMPQAGDLPAWPGRAREPGRGAEGGANPWPEIDAVAERFSGRRGEIGRLELAAKPQGADWRIDRLALANDAGTIHAEGWWRSRGKDQQTRLDVDLDVRNAAGFLARFGLPDAVKGAPTRIDGQLAWNGSPDEFEVRTLSGALKVSVGAGQFTKIEPGIGKLLGVLSLQALPRRITLDFRDVFSEGFAFDSIVGNVRIGSGVLHTENLLLAGPAAKVQITGDVDLQQETQRLTVVVQPSLATSVAGAGAAAALLLAHPAVAAVVGAGTLLAQKVMKDPIEQIFSYEYLVRGSWDEPLVDRVTRNRLGTSADAGGTSNAR